MQFPHWLINRVETTPDGTALLFNGETLSWQELYRRVLPGAGILQGIKAEANGRVALLMNNSPEFVVALHAISLAGQVAVPLNTRLSPAELNWQLQDVQANHLICDEANAEKAQQLNAGSSSRFKELSRIGSRETITLRGAFEQDEPHTVIYSSGTTGKPKGVVLTYGNHLWNALASCLNLGLHKDDRWLAVLPLFHVGGLSILIRSVLYGIPVVLHEKFDPAVINASIEQDRVTIISVVSNMLQRMLDERQDKPYPPHLRAVLVGGGPVPRPLLERCAALQIPVTQTYGMTETASQVCTLSPADSLRKLGSAGRALYPGEIAIDPTNVSPDGVGEILVRGPIVTPGYFNRPEETSKAIKDGWLHTGDLGYRDAEGYLYVVERRTDLIISGGENIYPAEIEAVLLSHPAVEEAGVTGFADERWGQVPVAVVKLRENFSITEIELLEWVSARLAKYKLPKRVYFRNSLPRNAAGKLVRRLLKDEINDHHTN